MRAVMVGLACALGAGALLALAALLGEGEPAEAQRPVPAARPPEVTYDAAEEEMEPRPRSPVLAPSIEDPSAGRGEHRIHVLCLAPSLSEPCANALVKVFRRSLDRTDPRAAELVKEVETDADGRALLRGLEPGAVLLCAPGANPRGAPPQVRSVVLQPGGGDLHVTLVAPAPKQVVRIRAVCQLERERGLLPKLFLRDLEGGELIPVPGTLRQGAQDLEVEVEPGAYLLGVVPLGVLLFDPAMPAFEVVTGEDKAVDAKLLPNRSTCEVTLEGHHPLDLPLRVAPRPRDAVLGPDESLLFLGSYRWQLATMTIKAPAQPARLVVHGRSGAYLSSGEVDFASGRVRVGLEPATMLWVHWLPGRMPAGKAALDVVAPGSPPVTLGMRRELLPREKRMVPGFRAYGVVPAGPCELVCWGTAGEEHWRRQVDVQVHKHLEVVER